MTEVERLFHAVLEQPEDRRRAHLAVICGGDEALRAEVEALLAQDARASRFLEPEGGNGPAQLALAPAGSLVGRTFGQYRVESLLGHGGMGQVYVATDTRLKRQVAIKTLRADLVASPSARRRIEREARVVAALSHPGIAKLFDVHTDGDLVLLVFELIDGITLRAHGRGRRLQIDEVIDLIAQVARALGAAHRAGITHRDVKPDNVMVLADGSIRVLDFGLAKRDAGRPVHAGDTTSQLTGPHAVGTLHYMSPEQLESRAVDHRSDLFSLGAMLYELTTGRLPFAADSMGGEIANILRCAPPPPRQVDPAIPADLEHLIMALLQRSPAARPPSADAVATALARCRTRPGPAVAIAAGVTEPQYVLGRQLARPLFLAAQLFYLALYATALRHLDAFRDGWGHVLGEATVELLTWTMLGSALAGIAVRLYLFALVAVDHVEAGVQYRRAFPLFCLLDALWAMTPLTLARDHGLWLPLACVAPLALLPFVQRALIASAYELRRGGRRPGAIARRTPPTLNGSGAGRAASVCSHEDG